MCQLSKMKGKQCQVLLRICRNNTPYPHCRRKCKFCWVLSGNPWGYLITDYKHTLQAASLPLTYLIEPNTCILQKREQDFHDQNRMANEEYISCHTTEDRAILMDIRAEQIRLSQLIFKKAMKLPWGEESGSEQRKRKSGG